jgi:Archaeal flagella assembly protein J
MHSCRPQKFLIVLSSFGLSFYTMSCGRDTRSNAEDSAKTIVPTAESSPVSAANTGWDENSAGQFMILSAADDGITAALVLPRETDSTLASSRTFQIDSFANASVDLFSTAGAAGKSNIAVNSQQPPAEGCLVWPAIRLVTKPSSPWTVGFRAGYAKTIQIDSVEKLSASDSLSVTTALVKQASVISMKGDPAFQGLPFIIRKAYRLSIGDTTALIGSIVRKINEEANPREEHLLLIVEQVGGSEAPYSVVYQNRSAGAEDAVRTNAVLAAVRFVKTNRAAIVLSFEYDDGGQVALLERVASNAWKITWRSAYTGC